MSEKTSIPAIVSLENQVKQLKLNPNKFSSQQRLLKFLEIQQLRKPELVVQYGEQILRDNKSKLGDSVWSVYEKVYIAALDCGDDDAARMCYTALKNKFPDSVHVRSLRALKHEADEEYKDAYAIYTDILQHDKTNTNAMKRKISIRIAQNDISNAIKDLTEYLNTFVSDTSAWRQLAELYVRRRSYELAKFCYEELLLSEPHNWQVHLQYAEVMYTLGGKNFEIARKYYCQALELNPENNMRALCGLAMCCRPSPDIAKSTTGKSLNAELFSWSTNKILNTYRKSAPHLVDIVESALSR